MEPMLDFLVIALGPLSLWLHYHEWNRQRPLSAFPNLPDVLEFQPQSTVEWVKRKGALSRKEYKHLLQQQIEILETEMRRRGVTPRSAGGGKRRA